MTAVVLTTPLAVARLTEFYRHAGKGPEPRLAVPMDDPELLSLLKPQHRPEQLSNWLSFRNIIREARERNLPFITVFEDDCILSIPYTNIIPYISKLPSDFRLCYIGGYFRSRNKDWSLQKHSEGIYKIKGSPLIFGKHAVVYGRNSYDELSGALVSDHHLSYITVRKGGCYVMYPQMAFQSHGCGVNGRFDFRELEQQSLMCLKRRV